MTAIDEIMLTDLAFADDFGVSASGDLDLVSGLANYKSAIFRRIITTPGTLLHRPTYGVGLKTYMGATGNLESLRRLTRDMDTQLRLDPRTEDIKSLSISSPSAGLFQIKLALLAKGYGLVNWDFLIGEDDL